MVADDDTQFGKEVPLTIGMKTEDTIFKAMKEGEIEMLDNIWKRVKNNRSLTKLREEVGFQELSELASTVRTEIIPPQSNKTIKA